jgi:hypothetical protein
MKRFILALGLILSFSLSASAWVSSNPMEKAYTFKFRLKGQTFEYAQTAGSYDDAFEKAAKACYQHYKAGQRLTEDRGLDIIDVCANPRTT